MNITRSKAKLVIAVCISLLAIMIAGCQPMIDASVRSTLGVETRPPNMAAIGSYPTNDPELKAYLTLISSLENDLQGVLGKEFTALDRQIQLKQFEDETRKIFINNPVPMSSVEVARFVDKLMDDEKRKNSPNYLSLLPNGADKKESHGRIHSMAVMGNESLENKTTSIIIIYKFSSAKEMSEKAYSIVEKLHPVFLTQSGWNFQDHVAYKSFLQDTQNAIEKNSAMQGANGVDPALKKRQKEFYERNLRSADAGEASIKYMWSSGYRSTIATYDTETLNQFFIIVAPQLEAINGKYKLGVIITRIIAQPRK